MWLIMAILSAFFAGITSILAKCGIKKTDSDVATALRTIVVLLFSWIMVFAAGSAKTISQISSRSLLFLILSGLATGSSWICYFKALSMGDVNKVVPVDKSSTVLTVLLAILLFHETDHLILKLSGTLLLAAGIFLMIEQRNTSSADCSCAQPQNTGSPQPTYTQKKTAGQGRGAENRRWLVYAVLSAVFASLTSILAKIGIDGVESNLGTAIRTGVVLAMAWIIVFLKNKGSSLLLIKKTPQKELVFIALSGFATGGSWLCYYYAIQNGPVSVVVPIDKLSILVTVLFSWLVFGETLSRKALLGLILMVMGTLIMVF